MNDWWKNPVLQGPENDYGDYDYLIEEIPSNSAVWSRYERNCDDCGKWHKLNLVYTCYFRTLDGYDSMDSCECCVCYLKRKLKQPFKVLKKKIKCFVVEKKEFHRYKKMFKKNNHPLTKEMKQTIKEIARRYAKRR